MTPVPFETTIYLYQDVPCDRGYVNTLYFSSLSEQESVFNGKKSRGLTSYSYQRVEDTYTLKVEIPFEEATTYNYMSFTNKGKTWYCFIDKAEYISDGVSRLTYSLDYIQSYLFDYELTISLVDRCHQSTDVIGDNIIEESFSGKKVVGDTRYNTDVSLYQSYRIVMLSTALYDYELSKVRQLECAWNAINQTFTGMYYSVYDFSNLGQGGPEDLIDMLSKLNSNTSISSVLSIMLVPWHIIGKTSSKYGGVILAEPHWEDKVYTITKPYPTKGLGNYKPKNNKLYTYPYNFIRLIESASGKYVDYAYERFGAGNAQFQAKTLMCSKPSVLFRPINYDYANETDKETFADDKNDLCSFEISGFPICDWSSDYYEAYLASQGGEVGYALNQALSLVSSVTGSAAKGVAAGSAGGVVGAVIGGVGGAVLGGAQYYYGQEGKLNTMCNSNHGSSEYGRGFAHLIYPIMQNYHYLESDLKIIDDYFSRYGYAQSKMMNINRNARAIYTYIKTADCMGRGDITNAAEDKIKSIYNKGITFWNSGYYNSVGNYSQSIMMQNTPRG